MGQKVTDQVAEMRSLPAGIDQRSRKKSQVIPGWNVFEQGHSAQPVTSQLCFDVYVIDYLGFKNETLTEERFISWHCISLHEN